MKNGGAGAAGAGMGGNGFNGMGGMPAGGFPGGFSFGGGMPGGTGGYQPRDANDIFASVSDRFSFFSFSLRSFIPCWTIIDDCVIAIRWR